MTRRTPIIHAGTVRVGGFIKMLAVHKVTGAVRELTPWFPNLVLDQGLNRMGTGSYVDFCHVGTDSTVPAVTDTALVSFVASTSTLQDSLTGASPSAPYYGYTRKTFRFAAGVAAGNIAEVGFGWGASGAVLFSRSLVKDGGGVPTPVTVLGDEYLDVVYELRCYAPDADTAPQIINVNGINYTLVVRPAIVTNANEWYPWNTEMGCRNTFWNSAAPIVFSGVIGAETSSPSGSQSARSSAVNAAYGNNNLYRDFTATWELNSGNVGGVQSIMWYTTLGTYQVSVSPALPKDGDNVMTSTMRLAWARYVP